MQQLKEPLTIIGVRPNTSYFHNTMRIVVLFILILILVMIYLAGNKPYNKKVSMHDIENIVKPGTQMYDSIMRMEEKDRMVYIAAMGKMLGDVDKLSRMHQIIKTVFTTLTVGFIVEYIIHGDILKTANIIGKTSLTATLMNIA